MPELPGLLPPKVFAAILIPGSCWLNGETRFIAQYGSRARHTFMSSYKWRLNGPYDSGSELCPTAHPFLPCSKMSRFRRWSCPFREPLHPSFRLRALLRT
jgi:hypothetical protein